MTRAYFEVDKGRFESALIRTEDGAMVAYTDGDEIKTTEYYTDGDRTALADFCSIYGLPVIKNGETWLVL